jgi:hypothetical protein
MASSGIEPATSGLVASINYASACQILVRTYVKEADMYYLNTKRRMEIISYSIFKNTLYINNMQIAGRKIYIYFFYILGRNVL